MTPFWDDRVADWVAKAAQGCARGFGECRTLGVHDGKKIVAGVVFHNWQPEDGVIEISSAATTARWMTRPIVRLAFGYAFDALGCRVVVARIHADNDRARKLWRGLGAEEHILPHLRGGAGECVSILTREAWAQSKFMKGGSNG